MLTSAARHTIRHSSRLWNNYSITIPRNTKSLKRKLTTSQEIKHTWRTIYNDILPSLFDTSYMLKAVKDIETLLKTENSKHKFYNITCIIEVRNIRMPYTSHPFFDTDKKHVIVYTHSNYLSEEKKEDIKRNVMQDKKSVVLFVDLYKHKKISDVEPFRRQILETMIEGAEEYNSSNEDKLTHISGLVVGLPNVGKSALTYVLSKETTKIKREHKTKHLPRVNFKPGVTTFIKPHWFDLYSDKGDITYKSKLIDTPGISLPLPYIKKQTNKEFMIQLGLIGVLPAKATKKRAPILVQYLLYRLNKAKIYDYVSHFKLEERTNDVNLLFEAMDKKLKGRLERKNDRNKYAEQIIMDWRNGLFGRDIILDSDYD